MAESHRRTHERVPCDAPAQLFTLASESRVCDLRLRDLGLGGALVESPVPLQRGVSYELRVKGARFPARVAREPKPDPKAKTTPYALVFTLTSAQEAQLTTLVDALRRGLWA